MTVIGILTLYYFKVYVCVDNSKTRDECQGTAGAILSRDGGGGVGGIRC